jgi:hypothetical protein
MHTQGVQLQQVDPVIAVMLGAGVSRVLEKDLDEDLEDVNDSVGSLDDGNPRACALTQCRNVV